MESVFRAIAKNYDSLNSVISLGQHRAWKRKMAVAAFQTVGPSAKYLDVGTGTGDVVRELDKLGASRLFGVDPCTEMLSVAEEKGISAKLSPAPSEDLPFESETFDAILSAFAVRNFDNFEKSFHEWKRVLRPGGSGFILEMHPPKGALFRSYWSAVVPLVGAFSSDRGSYEYLERSVREFHTPAALVAALKQLGFRNAQSQSVFGYGMVSLTRFEK